MIPNLRISGNGGFLLIGRNVCRRKVTILDGTKSHEKVLREASQFWKIYVGEWGMVKTGQKQYSSRS